MTKTSYAPSAKAKQKPARAASLILIKENRKEILIARLIAKASLDFKCCGHGKP